MGADKSDLSAPIPIMKDGARELLFGWLQKEKGRA